MTVSKEYNKHIYEGNGLTVDWPYDFDLPITAAGTPDTSLIHVFRTNLRGEVTEVTAFSVDAETGTLTYPTSGSPLETGEKLTILRLLDVRQQFFDPSNQANLYPETLEDNTDRLVMMVQQLQEETDRAVKVSLSTDLETEDTTAEGIFEARDIAQAAAETAEGYAAQLPAIADELGVNLVTDEADLRAKITVIGASDATLVIAASIPLAEDLTIPSNIALAFKNTGSLEPAVTKTLTVNGPVDAGMWQIFGGEGTVAIGTKVRHVYPQWFGAVGDGVEDDTDALQKAVDCFSDGGTVVCPTGTYLLRRTVGTNDHYGLVVSQSNVTLKGEHAEFKRYDEDISTYALAYPLLFLGTPDSNDAEETQDVTVDGITFIGNDTRHDIGGSSLSDFRMAIVLKNTRNTTITDCVFRDIDSSAIIYQKPADLDYTNAVYYNTTKNYDSRIVNCSFYGKPHEITGRALLHAIVLKGIDRILVSGCYFEWCDDCVFGETSYDLDSALDSPWTPEYAGWILGDVKRSGYGWIITNNSVLNSSEHSFYIAGRDVVVSGNTIKSDSAVCKGNIKIRSRNVVVSGNTISLRGGCIGITEPSANVTVTGNVCKSLGEGSAGVIDLDSHGLTDHIDDRPWLAAYLPMANITISGNSILLPDTAATENNLHYGMRVYTNSSDVNYAEGQIQGLTISGNTFKGHWAGIFFKHTLTAAVNISGNTFNAKAFDRSGFSSATAVLTRGVIMAEEPNCLIPVSFTGNVVNGCSYLFCTSTGALEASSIYLPRGCSNNRFNYVQAIATPDFKPVSMYTKFTDNAGLFFLDRTWSGTGLNNSLHDGSNAKSANRYCFNFNGTNVLFYSDDDGTFITL